MCTVALHVIQYKRSFHSIFQYGLTQELSALCFLLLSVTYSLTSPIIGKCLDRFVSIYLEYHPQSGQDPQKELEGLCHRVVICNKSVGSALGPQTSLIYQRKIGIVALQGMLTRIQHCVVPEDMHRHVLEDMHWHFCLSIQQQMSLNFPQRKGDGDINEIELLSCWVL